MARRSIDITITPELCPSVEGRDNGKVFRVTEMPALQAEEWGTRATLALVPRLQREVPKEVADELKANPSMLGVERARLLLGDISFPEMRELSRELMDACVQVVTDERFAPQPLNFGGNYAIEEVETIRFLRGEA